MQNVGTYNEDIDDDNKYPAIQLTVVDPDGEPWNTNMIDLFPNAGEIETDVDEYRSSEKKYIVGVSVNDGV